MSTRRLWIMLAITLVVAVVLVVVAWWPALAPRPEPTPTPTATLPTATSTNETGSAPTGGATPPATPTAPIPVEPAPEADFDAGEPEGQPMAPDDTDPAEAAQIVSAATTFMNAYARQDGIDPNVWWERVKATLTDQTARDAEGVTPDVIPWTTVTGPGMLVPPWSPDDDSAHIARMVDVPTDAGTWRVTVELATMRVQQWAEVR